MNNKNFCNICGVNFDLWDKQEQFGFHYKVGYGSIYDGDEINLDMCCNCFDKLLTEYLLPKCKINPILKGE